VVVEEIDYACFLGILWAVTLFEESVGLDPTGEVDEATFSRLVQPTVTVLEQRLTASLSVEPAVLDYAAAHLDVHSLEVGGQNKGPWVRLYMGGHEGTPWPWCAGFVTFVLSQAVESLNATMPIAGSVSCDTLAAQAREAGLLLPEEEAQGSLRPGSIFLIRRTATDWTHTGFVTDVHDGVFDTIEGNTNDDGSREGFEVCARSRGLASTDFIFLS
jgi:CHAP domain